MAYPYVGPELALLKRFKSAVESERSVYARRAKKDAVLAIGSGTVFGLSTSNLITSMAANGIEHLDTLFPNMSAIGLPLLAFSIPVSLTASMIAIPFWVYNATKVKEKDTELSSISNRIKTVEKGVFE